MAYTIQFWNTTTLSNVYLPIVRMIITRAGGNTNRSLNNNEITDHSVAYDELHADNSVDNDRGDYLEDMIQNER